MTVVVKEKTKETIKFNQIKKGMILINKIPKFDYKTLATKYFDVRIKILGIPATVQGGYQGVMYAGGCEATVQVVQVGEDPDGAMREGDEGILRMKFKYGVEYIEKDQKMLMRENITSAYGTITDIYHMLDPPADLDD